MYHFKIVRECIWYDGSIGFIVHVWRLFYWSRIGMKFSLDDAKEYCNEYVNPPRNENVTFLTVHKNIVLKS